MLSFSFSLEELPRVARSFWENVPEAAVFAFYGAMGAGKTTFINALCKVKGVNEITGSPTFSIINDYVFTDHQGSLQHLYHMDLYRLRDEEEAIQAGVEDCLYSGSTCMVEWPEKAEALLPPETIRITLSIETDSRRLLTIQPGRISAPESKV